MKAPPTAPAAVIAALLAACAPQPSPNAAVPATPPGPIDTVAIRGYTRFLSDDALRGRATGTPEADIAAVYIQSACIGLGLQPVSGGYSQSVNLHRITINPSGTGLMLSGPAGRRAFQYRSGFMPNFGLETRSGFSGPAVYVGHSDDIAEGRLGNLNLRGAVAVVAGPVLDVADDSLAARAIAGVIQLTADEAQYALYVRSRGDSRLRLDDSAATRSLAASTLSIVASPLASREILGGNGPSGAPRMLPDTITVEIALNQSAVTSANVGCMVPGADPKFRDTAIVYTAHYDHLGISVPDMRGDSIYNGFSDNAAGVGMLLAIGQAFSRSPAPPRHSIILLFFTGEEQGMLGSDYYVAHPLWPLERVAGVINLDAGAPPARPWSWRIAGKRSDLSQLAQDVAATRGWSATTSDATPNSDYYPFARKGVPAIFIVPGTAPYQGLSADSSQALRRRWDHYHEAADEWAPDFPFAGLGRYAEYAYMIGRAMDGPLIRDVLPSGHP